MSSASLVFISLLLTSGPTAPTAENVVVKADDNIKWQDDLQTGTLLVSQGDCLAVKVFSRSKYTHVAAVVIEEGQPVVYESANGTGARRLSLEKYLKVQSPDTIDVLHPKRKLSPQQHERFVSHLQEELGRPYAVRHHLTGEQVEGVHCSEYIIEALMNSKLMRAKNPARVSPGSLAEGAVQSGLYHKPISIDVNAAPFAQNKTAGMTWCARMWLDTKICTTNCCVQIRRWVLCR